MNILQPTSATTEGSKVTRLTLRVDIKEPLSLKFTFKPSPIQRLLTSTLVLTNGTFAPPDNLTFDTRAGVSIVLPNTKTIQLRSIGGPPQLIEGNYYVDFPSNVISVDGLIVQLNDPGAVALRAEASHKLGTGRFSVASTTDPQGDVLESFLDKRVLVLVV